SAADARGGSSKRPRNDARVRQLQRFVRPPAVLGSTCCRAEQPTKRASLHLERAEGSPRARRAHPALPASVRQPLREIAHPSQQVAAAIAPRVQRGRVEYCASLSAHNRQCGGPSPPCPIGDRPESACTTGRRHPRTSRTSRIASLPELQKRPSEQL